MRPPARWNRAAFDTAIARSCAEWMRRVLIHVVLRASWASQRVGEVLGERSVRERVHPGVGRPSRLARPLDVCHHPEPAGVDAVDHGLQQLIRPHRADVGVQRDLDEAGAARRLLGDRRIHILRAYLAEHRRRRPRPRARVPTDRGEDLPGAHHLDVADVVHPARVGTEIEHPPQSTGGHRRGIHQVEVHVEVGEPAHCAAIRVLTSNSSGEERDAERALEELGARRASVPVPIPIVRCTVRRCRNRHSWKLSSRSTSSSQVSYTAQFASGCSYTFANTSMSSSFTV